MDYYLNSKIEEATIYEIYKACRLCGAGAGYKMPIIQNVVNFASGEIELKQKIRECVQMEVHQDDKMPPLICELCVDKVNDFYEFLEMCRQTNMKTRLRLGLPPQKLSRGAPDAGDCILGLTEPVYINNCTSDGYLKKNKAVKNLNIKKEPETKPKSRQVLERQKKNEAKLSITKTSILRSGRLKEPSPPPLALRLRGTKRSSEDSVSSKKLFKQSKSEQNKALPPKSILKKSREVESLLEDRNKRERNPIIQPSKKVKITVNVPVKPKAEFKPTRVIQSEMKCNICKMVFKTIQALKSHQRIHYKSSEHKHKTISKPEVIQKSCSKCNKSYASLNLLRIHKCVPKRVPSCNKCKRSFMNLNALGKHEKYCRRTDNVKVSRTLRTQLRPLQVRLAKCDMLLDETQRCDTSNVPFDYGLDKNCVYPYLHSKSLFNLHIKSELTEYNSMVKIHDDIKDELDLDARYIYWDSDSDQDYDTDSMEEIKDVKRLSTLSLKIIFSPKLLGKVPRKLRKIQYEKPFDSILDASEADPDIDLGISNLIDSLHDPPYEKNDKRINDDLFFNDIKGPGVKNSDFDEIFGNDSNSDDKGGSDDKSLNINSEGSCDMKVVKSKNDEACSNLNTSKDIILEDHNQISQDSLKNSIKDRNVTVDVHIPNVKEADFENKGDTAVDDCNKLVDKLDDQTVVKDIVNSSISSLVLSNQKSNIDKVSDKLECENKFEENYFDEKVQYMETEKTTASDNHIAKILSEIDTKENETLAELGSNKNNETLEKPQEIGNNNTNIKESVLDDALSLCNPATNINKNNNSFSSEVDTSRNNDIHHKSCEDNEDTDVAEKFNIDELEDVSDTDMDDNKLMEALDAQIGEDDMKKEK